MRRHIERMLSASNVSRQAGGRCPTARTMRFEPLERRCLLAATDMAAITGMVFQDVTGDGYTAGEEVAGAEVRLYRDDNDNGAFDPGAGDNQVTNDTTDADGLYRFDGLTAGTYFVQQIAQPLGSVTLGEEVSAAIVISATDVQGVAGMVVDSFNTTSQSITAPSDLGDNPDYNATDTAAGEAVGNERDLFAELTSGAGTVSIEVLDSGFPTLTFSASSRGDGTRIATWDGDDDDGQTLNALGLGGIDLTESGANSGFQLALGADQDTGSVVLRVYTDATQWSQAEAAIPNTGGTPDETIEILFTDFSQGTGAADAVTWDNVGAIQLEITSSGTAVDGEIDFIGLIGPTLFTENFANFETADLELEKTVDDATPNLGQNVVFTVSLTNDGPDTATGVIVADTLPAGLTYVSDDPSQGTYTSGTGLWDVGTLTDGATATLEITATVDVTTTVTNSAQVQAADQADPDSTPNNGIATEDDQDSASVAARQADLSLTKTVDDAEPDLGDSVVFTVTVANDGPDTATGVTVSDTVPAGLTYVSSNPGQGTYTSGTGLWDVGSLVDGASATLEITATVDAAGTTTNTAQVATADQADPDSTPGNSAGGEDDQASASVTPLGSLSGFVYADADNDGTFDAGETGIAGVALVLTGTDDLGAAVSRSATTAADGSYEFTGLRPSNDSGYTIAETQPSTYLDGQDQDGSLGGTVGSPSSLDRISQIPLGSGQAGQNYNFGELQPASISGYVYYDANRDGTRQATEAGIPGITVTLTGTDDLGAAVDLSLTTAADGSYQFADLRPSGAAGYTLTESQPAGFQDGAESAGTPSLDAAVADDVFSSLDLEQGVDAVEFDFAEIIRVISKRRFLASAQ